jgi:hypothetical protein
MSMRFRRGVTLKYGAGKGNAIIAYRVSSISKKQFIY